MGSASISDPICEWPADHGWGRAREPKGKEAKALLTQKKLPLLARNRFNRDLVKPVQTS